MLQLDCTRFQLRNEIGGQRQWTKLEGVIPYGSVANVPFPPMNDER